MIPTVGGIPQSVILAPVGMCPTCSKILQPVIESMGKTKVSRISVACLNCGWEMTDVSFQFLSGETPKKIPQERLEQLRAEAAAVEERNSVREKSMSEIIAILPKLREVVRAFAQNESEASAATETPEAVGV